MARGASKCGAIFGLGSSEESRDSWGFSSSEDGLLFLVESCTLFDGIISIYDILLGLGASYLNLLIGAGKMDACWLCYYSRAASCC